MMARGRDFPETEENAIAKKIIGKFNLLVAGRNVNGTLVSTFIFQIHNPY
jgi:hypothetical protein